jgi:hypothetical protein
MEILYDARVCRNPQELRASACASRYLFLVALLARVDFCLGGASAAKAFFEGRERGEGLLRLFRRLADLASTAALMPPATKGIRIEVIWAASSGSQAPFDRRRARPVREIAATIAPTPKR